MLKTENRIIIPEKESWKQKMNLVNEKKSGKADFLYDKTKKLTNNAIQQIDKTEWWDSKVK